MWPWMSCDAQFQRWRNDEIVGSEPIAAIHDFYPQDARSSWSTFRASKESEIVARGLALGLIAADAVPQQLRIKLEPFLEHVNRPVR